MYQDEGDDDDDDDDMENAGGMDGKGIMYNDFFNDGNTNKNKSKDNKKADMKNGKEKDKNSSKGGKPTMFKRGMDFLDKEVENDDDDDDDDDEYYGGKHKEHDDDEDEDDDADFDDENIQDDYHDDDDEENDNNNDDEDDVDEEEEIQNLKKLTKFEKAQLANQKVIQDLEKQVTGQKSWDMRGEVKGLDRPENSLLEITADIERYVDR